MNIIDNAKINIVKLHLPFKNTLFSNYPNKTNEVIN